MEFALRPVAFQEKEILRNLLEKYQYEFSQYTREDMNDLGLYGYNWLDCYWTEKKRHAFFLLADGRLAGFALVNDYDEGGYSTDWSMSEFFVAHKYRRLGLGRWAAHRLFARFPGQWQLMCHPRSTAACAFWDSVVRAGAAGAVRLIAPAAQRYPDGSPGHVYLFHT